MLNQENLQEFTNKFQTSKKNIMREYVQHLFLSSLYKMRNSENLLFKGGTALRVIFQSPRFSEDLDFTGQNIHRCSEIDEMFIGALSELEKMGINIYFKEAKPTTGGYLGLIHYEIFDQPEDMKFEVSLRKGKRQRGELVNIVSDFIPAYSVVYVSQRYLAGGKMDALLARKKPRDFYDLYFMLRHPELNKFIDKNKLKIIFESIKTERMNFKKELSVLLPMSQHLILKNLKSVLQKEIRKYI
jgi:predicted nucleotidyltransferase component of viral defense system